MPKYITKNIESSSDESDKEESNEKNSDEKKSNKENYWGKLLLKKTNLSTILLRILKFDEK